MSKQGIIIERLEDGSVKFSPPPLGPTPKPPDGYRLLERGIDEWQETDLLYNDLGEQWEEPLPGIFMIGSLFNNAWPKYPPARKLTT